MCLTLQPRKTARIKKEWQSGARKYWKLLERRSGELLTCYRCMDISCGRNISSRRNTTLSPMEKRHKQVHFGAHVFNTRRAAELEQVMDSDVLVAVWCRPQDLVAVGMFNVRRRIPSSVFTQYTIRKRDYERALRTKT